MWISIQAIIARVRIWWASQFMDEPEETIYHTLPHPLPHNEEYYTYHTTDAGQDAATTRGPEYRNGKRL